MTQPSFRSLGLLMLAGGFLGAQTLPEALKLLPANAASVEVYPRLARAEDQWGRLQGRLGKSRDRIEPFLASMPGDLAGLKEGPVVVGNITEAGTGVKSKIYVLPIARFATFTKGLGAKPAGSLWKVRMKGRAYFIARRGNFALLSADAERVKGTGAMKENLGGDLGSLAPWISSHDLVLVVPSQATRTALGALGSQGKGSPDPAKASLLNFMKPLLEKGVASVGQIALAVDFPAGGGAKGFARAFLVPGSPLALALKERPESQGHPMAGLPLDGFALGGGGPIPRSLALWGSNLLAGFLSAADPAKDPALAARWAETQGTLAKNLRSQSMSLGVPAHEGDPLLGNFRALYRVDDVALHLRLMEASQQDGNPLAQPIGGKVTVDRDVLPGVPSLTITRAFGKGEKTGLPVQAKALLTLLTGSGDSLTVSAGRVDDHTLLVVMGGAEALKAGLAAQGPSFAADPGVAATDAMLGGDAPWRFYFNLQGIGRLTRLGMAAFVQGKSFPELPAVPPMGLALDMDSTGIELRAAVPGDTLDAMGAFFQGVKALFPQPAAPKPESGGSR